jgi:hypothetical protein
MITGRPEPHPHVRGHPGYLVPRACPSRARSHGDSRTVGGPIGAVTGVMTWTNARSASYATRSVASSQADSEGSIPFTRSTKKAQVRDVLPPWAFVFWAPRGAVVPLACH